MAERGEQPPVQVNRGDRKSALPELPNTWSEARIGDISTVSRKPHGLDFNAAAVIPFAPMALIPDDRLDLPPVELRPPSAVKSGVYIQNGDVLLAKITP